MNKEAMELADRMGRTLAQQYFMEKEANIGAIASKAATGLKNILTGKQLRTGLKQVRHGGSWAGTAGQALEQGKITPKGFGRMMHSSGKTMATGAKNVAIGGAKTVGVGGAGLYGAKKIID